MVRYSCTKERSHSGLVRRFAKPLRVYRPPRVRIPPSPPILKLIVLGPMEPGIFYFLMQQRGTGHCQRLHKHLKTNRFCESSRENSVDGLDKRGSACYYHGTSGGA